jgi:hypothetical protein
MGNFSNMTFHLHLLINECSYKILYKICKLKFKPKWLGFNVKSNNSGFELGCIILLR